MSRSAKGKKAPGYDYWGRRGMCDKETTKKSERVERRKLISNIKKREEPAHD